MPSKSAPAEPAGSFDIAQAMALSSRSVKSRLAFAALFALASVPVLTWIDALAWLAAVTIWETLGRPTTDRLLLQRGEKPALVEYAVLKGASATIFGALGGLTMASGHPLGMILGTAWIIGSITHTFVYYGSCRTVLFATMAPACAWVGIGAYIGLGPSLEALIGVGAVLSALSGGALFLVDRKALLAELDRSRVDLAVAEAANTAKSHFIATMSHELRTPLNAIIGYSEMMQEVASEDGRNTDTADHDRVLRASRHLLTMINEILDLSKMEAGRVELDAGAFDVEKAAQEALDAIEPIARSRGNQLRLEVRSSDFGSVSNDAFRLHQCLINLLGNAAKFTHEGVITLRVARDGAALVFEIEDTGIGIAPERMGALFQPFVQADVSMTREYGGTGLGLVITRRLARLMGGDVVGRSVPGKGSTFTLTIAAELPASASDDEAEVLTPAREAAQAA